MIKETNSVTKLIFETVPYYNFGSSEPIPGQYLNFPQASRVVADIKTLGKKARFKDLDTFKVIKQQSNKLSSDT